MEKAMRENWEVFQVGSGEERRAKDIWRVYRRELCWLSEGVSE